jgi:3'(2'), 5'-bisphosphate nucleotidase
MRLSAAAAVALLCQLVLPGARGFAAAPVPLAHVRRPTLRSAHAGCVPVGMAAAAGGRNSVDVVELLGCCVCACERAARVIRAVEAKRSAGGLIAGAVLKDSTDDRSYLTEADTEAQRVIMQTLRHSFPEVTIIGEEDEEGEGPETACGAGDDLANIMSRVGSEFKAAPAELRTVPVAEVCVFVDPVDGTKEFVEGRLEAVQTLIGVSIRGRSVAGAVGIPFMPAGHAGDESVHVMYGVADVGAQNIPPPSGQRPDTKTVGAILVASPSGKEPALQVAKSGLHPAAIITPGGVGNKILSVLRGDADCALMHLSTSLWDTCAPEALLRAQGGKMTTLLGTSIDHSAGARVLNVEGVFVTSEDFKSKDKLGRTHDQLCSEWVASSVLRSE